MPIVKYGTDAQKRRDLPTLATGEMRIAFSFTEPDARTDTSRITTRAVRDGDYWVVNGCKVWTSHAKYAHKTLLLACTTPLRRGCQENQRHESVHGGSRPQRLHAARDPQARTARSRFELAVHRQPARAPR
jgi:hypothetical protein